MDGDCSLSLELNSEDIDLDFSDPSSEYESTLQNIIKKCLGKTTLYNIADAVRAPFPAAVEIQHIIQRIILLIPQLQTEKNVFNSIVDGLKIEIELRWCLLIIVKGSGMGLNIIPDVEKTASKAITILNAAKIPFSGMDLSGVCIPGANLERALLDNTNFSFANLKKVNFKEAFLRKAKFNDALMEDVIFGELPYVEGSNSILKWEKYGCCCYSFDGKWIAVSNNHGFVKLLDPESLQFKKKINCNSGWFKKNAFITDIKFDPSGKLLAVVNSHDNTIQIWNIITEQRIHVLSHASRIKSVLFLENNMLTASENILREWNIETGASCVLIRCEFDIIGISSNADFYIAYCKDEEKSDRGNITIYIYDIINKFSSKLKKKIKVESMSYLYSNATISIDNRWLAIHCRYKERADVFLYDLIRGKQHCFLSDLIKEQVEHLTFSFNGRLMALSSREKMIHIFDVAALKHVYTIQTQMDYFNKTAFSPCGGWLVYCKHTAYEGDPGRLYFHNIEQSHLFDIKLGIHKPVHDLYILPNINRMISRQSCDRDMYLWNTSTGEYCGLLDYYNCSGYAFNATVSPDGEWLAYSDFREIRIINLTNKKSFNIDTKHTIESLAFNPDSTLIASGGDSNDFSIRIWNFLTGECKYIFLGHSKKIQSLVFSPDGSWLASSDCWISSSNLWRPTVRIWDLKIGKQNICLKYGIVTNLSSLSFSPNSQCLAIAAGDTVDLWNIQQKKYIKKLNGHIRHIPKLTFDLSGKWLASADCRGVIRLWNIHDNYKCLVIEGHSGSIYGLVFSKDGRFLFSGCDNTSINCWRIYDDKEQPNPCLEWMVNGSRALFCKGMELTDVQGLDRKNLILLQQKGAVGSPSTDTGILHQWINLKRQSSSNGNEKMTSPQRPKM